MKKFLSFVFIFVVAITLTGCGKKTITCEGDITEGNITSTVKVTGNFENDKLKSQNIEMIFDMTDFLQFADIHTYYNAFKEQYETFNDYEGITSTVSQGENTIKVVMEVDLENVEISTKVKNNNETDFYLENFQMIIKDKNGNILTTLNQTVEENLAANSEVTYNNKYTLNLINATSIEYNVNINVHE